MQFRTTLSTLLALAVLGVEGTDHVHADREITATIGSKRVKAKVNTDTQVVKEAKVERLAESNEDWKEEEPETEVLNSSLESDDAAIPASFADCNENGLDDLVEIANGNPDLNINLVPDSCEYQYGDLNLDGNIDESDVFIVFGWFSAPFPIFGDLNEDGFVDASDLGIVLARWGSSPF